MVFSGSGNHSAALVHLMTRKKKAVREVGFHVRCDEKLVARVHEIIEKHGLRQNFFLVQAIEKAVNEAEKEVGK